MAVEKSNVVVVEHEFNAPVAKVFEALQAGRLFFNCGAWSEGTTIDFKVGGKYRFNWGHHGSTYGEFTEIVKDKRVAFSWNFDDMNVKSRVAIDLVPQGKGCKVKLRHEGFEDQEIAESHNGGLTEGLAGFDAELTQYRLRIEREFVAPVEMLYEACSGLQFFSQLGAKAETSNIDFRVGGKYSCKVENGGTIHGEFLEIEKNKKIVFTWEAAPCGTPIEKTTTVRMEFGPWGDGRKNSYLELIHEGFTSAEATCQHHTGWNQTVWKIYNRVCR